MLLMLIIRLRSLKLVWRSWRMTWLTWKTMWRIWKQTLTNRMTGSTTSRMMCPSTQIISLVSIPSCISRDPVFLRVVFRIHCQKSMSSVADLGCPRGGGANSPGGGGANIRFCQNFSKTAWNWKNLDPKGGARPKFYYVDPPLVILTTNFMPNKQKVKTCRKSMRWLVNRKYEISLETLFEILPN